MGLGVDQLPPIPIHAGDRNRTSPFAFTGNRFEFRALGSNQSISGPCVVLNTIVAESVDFMTTELESAIQAGASLEEALRQLIREVMVEVGAILFDGDGYAKEWHEEAARRGLPNYRDTVEALPHLLDAKNVEVFEKYDVLSKREVESRFDVYMEQYIKTLNIEAETTASIARTSILPTALTYQGRIAESVTAVTAAGCESKGGREVLAEVCELASEFKSAIDDLARANDHGTPATRLEHALYMRDQVLPAMNGVRASADRLEKILPDDLWPLPTYREMLFIK
jgi:glutamine synthetase